MFPQVTCEFIRLHKSTQGSQAPYAYVLLVRKIVPKILPEDTIFDELCSKRNDKKQFTRRGIMDMKSRWRLKVADKSQEPDYTTSGRGIVHSFEDMPCASALRNFLLKVARTGGVDKMSSPLSAEAAIFHAQYKPSQRKYVRCSGIGFHGDERKLIIGASVGDETILEFHAYRNRLFTGKPVTIQLGHGDMYFMSQAASGHDWTQNGYANPHYRYRVGFREWLDMDMKLRFRIQQKRRALQNTNTKSVPAAKRRRC